MGLLLAGTGSSKSEEMLTYAHETKHDKIIRGLSVGIAMTVYEQVCNFAIVQFKTCIYVCQRFRLKVF